MELNKRYRILKSKLVLSWLITIFLFICPGVWVWVAWDIEIMSMLSILLSFLFFLQVIKMTFEIKDHCILINNWFIFNKNIEINYGDIKKITISRMLLMKLFHVFLISIETKTTKKGFLNKIMLKGATELILNRKDKEWIEEFINNKITETWEEEIKMNSSQL